jgi:hypothetical protein
VLEKMAKKPWRPDGGPAGTWTEDEDFSVQVHGGREGRRFPSWFQIERNSSVAIDGRNTSTVIVEQSGEKNTAL